MEVWAVVKDPGGLRAVMPVVNWLRKQGHSVLVITNGKAKEMLAQGNDCVAVDKVDEVENYPLPKVMLTSMCSAGGVGRDLVPLLRGKKIPTVAIQDYWGARLYTDWPNLEHRPDHICVNDELGTQMVLQAWPEFDSARIQELGFAAFDHYAEYDQPAARKRAAQKLCLERNTAPVILYGGQLEKTGQTLAELVYTLEVLGNEVVLIARPHPRMRENAPDEAVTWNNAISQLDCGRVITDSSSCDPDEVVSVSDLVVTMFSTMLVDAAYLRKPSIAMLYPESGQEAYRISSGGNLSEPPPVVLGCSKKATCRQELFELLGTFTSFGGLGIEHRQSEVFRSDGKSAERIGTFALSLI